MARTAYLRPTADISLQHTCSSGSSGYAMIDEETSDEDSTYIQHSLSTSTTTKTSSFTLSGTIPAIKNGEITAAKLVIVAYRPTVVASITCSGTAKLDSGSTNNLTITGGEWATTTINLSTSDFACGSTYSKTLTLATTGYVSKNSCNVRITQAYIEITYDATYTITTTQRGHGGSYTTPITAKLDESATITFTLDSDKHLLKLLDNGTSVSWITNSDTECTYTLTSLTDDHNLIAYFELLFRKINGTWTEVPHLYKKVNGSWKEIADYDAVLSIITTPLL